MTNQLPRRFHLQRDTDISGVSGTGRVADGVLWPDGTVSLRWIGARPSVVFWDRLEDAEAVHGHGGATRIVWDDEPATEQPPAPWVDGDPLMEAIANTVWERCAHDDPDMPQLVCDDPRTIAAAAAHAVRTLQAAEEPTTTKPETGSCAHCGKTILRISGTLAEWWVHDPGGHTICFPEQAASSPRATLRPAVEARQDGAQPSEVTAFLATACDACTHALNWHRNEVGCTVPNCVCGQFHPRADEWPS